MPGRLSPAALPPGLRPRRSALSCALLLGLALFLGAGCNSALVHGLATALAETPGPAAWSYAPVPGADARGEAELLARFAPLFVVAQGEAEWNRIGTPSLSRRAGIERARVDPAAAAMFAEVRRERVGERAVLQLVYRIHFDQFAPRAAALASVHRNAGLLVLVSVDEQSALPLCVTSVHTCGCWLAVVPTAALSAAALPPEWSAERLEVAGESLPARIAVPAAGQRFVVHLRSGTHRVHDLSLADAQEEPAASARGMRLRAMDELHRLPIAGAPGETGSFFYRRGYLRGYVKGAWAPLEGLSLGLLTLDPRLGMDRDFGDPAVTGARFFTALAPWKREASRLDRFGQALEELGFRLSAFGPGGGD